MATPLEDVLTALVDLERTVEGLQEVYLTTPEAMLAFPCATNYLLKGREYREEASTVHGLHTVGCEVHVSRALLPSAETLARPLVGNMLEVLWNNPTLSNTVSTLLDVRWMIAPMRFSNEWHLGIRFEIDFKLRRAASI